MTCGADGVAFGAKAFVLLRFEKAVWLACGGDFGAVLLGKLSPAKASVIPPNGSF